MASRRGDRTRHNRSSPDPTAEARPRRPGRESSAARRGRAVALCRRLESLYPGARCSLDFGSPFELLIATILSAQCTDRRVNLVTPALFGRWPDAAALAAADAAALESVIRSTGFFRAKARNIRACCQALVERHGGQVPATLAELVALPGVGRKTGSVVLGSALGKAEGVVVDTHVGRLSRRLGLSRAADAVRVERDLIAVIPADDWIALSHRLIEHGRAVCAARTPRCTACSLSDLCPRVGVGPGRGKRSPR